MKSLLVILGFLVIGTARAESPSEKSDSILLTIVLKHDQHMNVTEIQKIQTDQGFYKAFPPAGTKIVSWHVLMGLGQVVTLQVPAAKLRDVNLAIERTAWKAFSTEVYATYDLYPTLKDQLANSARAVP